MVMELVHIGFGNILVMNRVIALALSDSTPTKRTIQEGRSKGLLIDATKGRKTKTAIYLDSGHVVLSALTTETIAGRMQAGRANPALRLEQSDDRDES
ncbi:extracellular matrix/biofilm biosynthesis regulator RemA family protein [Chloroflexota bacterium]